MPLRRFYRTALSLLTFCVLNVSPAAAQTTAVFMDSQPGDPVGGGVSRTFQMPTAAVSLVAGFGPGITVGITGSGVSWHLSFSAERDARLAVGTYAPVGKHPFTTGVGFVINGGATSCFRETGRFEVREIAYAGDGMVQRLAIDFEHHCDNANPALFGAIRYNSTIASLTPFGGAYPRYGVSITPETHGTVTAEGIACGPGLGTCSRQFASPATLTLTATPEPGYVFTGWSGACSGLAVTTITVNTSKLCRATFDTPLPAARRTLLFWNSAPGEYIGEGKSEIYNGSNATWTVSPTGDGNGVSIRIDTVDNEGWSFWTLDFRAPQGSPLTPGVYLNATMAAIATTTPGIDISGNHRGCGPIGTFVVHEVQRDSVTGSVTALAVDFAQRCGELAPALTGSLRFNSALPRGTHLCSTPDPYASVGGGTCDSGTWLPPGSTVPDGTTALFIDSQPGDPVGAGGTYSYAAPSTTFLIGRNEANGVSVSVKNGTRVEWSLDFSAPGKVPITTGTYLSVSDYPSSPFAGLGVSGQGSSCAGVTGHFVVREVVYGIDGSVLRFDVDFEQHCGDGDPALFGALRYRSTSAATTPFAGSYPVYQLMVTAPAHGTISSASSIACGGGQLACQQLFAAPSTVTLTAAADPGYIFMGWEGSCRGTATTTVRVNSIKSCGARFEPLVPAGGRTMMLWESQAGEPVGRGQTHVLSPANSDWTVQSSAGRNTIEFAIKGTDGIAVRTWRLDFRAIAGTPLSPGTFTQLAQFHGVYPADRYPAVSVSEQGSCDAATGRFIIHEVDVAGDGTVRRFAADLEHHCRDGDPALFVAIRFNSTVAETRPFAGAFPRYELAVQPPTRGVVTGDGINCGSGLTACGLAFGAPASVAMTAAANPGYVFAGWAGDCRAGPPATTVRVNSIKECIATFEPIVPAAPRTVVVLDSQEGDIFGGQKLTFTPANSVWKVVPWGGGGVRMTLHHLRTNGTFVEWNIVLQPPTGKALTAGAYSPAGDVSAVRAGMSVNFCGDATGRFVVHDVAFASDGSVLRLAADVEHHCSDAGPGLFLAIRYNTMAQGTAAFGGAYPTYFLDVVPPANGRIAGAGISCGGGQLSCTASFGAPTLVTLTATPDAGYVFAGWGGACGGGQPTLNLFVNSVRQCKASFLPRIATATRTFASFYSDDELLVKGRSRVFSSLNSEWVLTPFLERGVGVAIRSMEASGRSQTWSVNLSAREGGVLAEGTYSPTLGLGSSFPGLDIGRDTSACHGSGRFVVHEIERAHDGSIVRLAVDVEHHCPGYGAGLYVALRFNSAWPETLAFGGEFPRFHLTIDPPAGGRIAGESIACGGGQVACSVGFSAPANVTLTAIPNSGFAFAGWTGSCAGSHTTTVSIAGVERCGTVFVAEPPASPRTVIALNSAPGETVGQGRSRVYSLANSFWTVREASFPDPGGVELLIDGYEDRSEIRWRLRFLSVGGLYSGEYKDLVYRGGTLPAQALIIGTPFPGCDPVLGWFLVHEIDVDLDTREIRKFAIDFRQQCKDLLTPALTGSVRYNSTVPLPPGGAPPLPPPPPPPITCTTPDPFAALGGGTCYQGGWLPPGMPIPGAPPPPPTPPPPSSGGCTTPDPFAALGGGTCYEGGWLPPGMPIPGAPPPPPPSTPPPPPPTPPPPSGGCTTPDPFVALGGGTCFAGGWLPPGMPIPGAPPAAPPPSTPPPPPPTPPPSSGGCTTPDPFVALGGGTCYEGGWLPPGMPIPGAPPSGPPPPAPPPPTAPPSSGGCTTPDPFVALGGGTCYAGGWLPPGMPIPGAPPSTPPPSPPPPASPPPTGGCATPDPFVGIPGLIGVCRDGGWIPVPGVSGAGTVQFYDGAGGFWAIIGDDGTVYQPVPTLDNPLRIPGARVSFSGQIVGQILHTQLIQLVELRQIARQ